MTFEALAAAGVPGFKCFLVDPGIDGFTMVAEEQLRRALPHVSRTGLPLLVHAELPGPINRATDALADADWNCYSTYVQSRPDEAEVAAIRMLLSLCREYNFRLHIVHLSTCHALEELRAARSEGLSGKCGDLPALLAFGCRNDCQRRDAKQMRAANSQPRKLREIVAGTPRGDDRPCGDRPFTLSSPQ